MLQLIFKLFLFLDSPPSYKPGGKGVFPADAMLYAMWVTTEYDFPYTGTYVRLTIPQDGIYEFEVWDASGAAAKVDSHVAEGGLGGHSKGYKKLRFIFYRRYFVTGP